MLRSYNERQTEVERLKVSTSEWAKENAPIKLTIASIESSPWKETLISLVWDISCKDVQAKGIALSIEMFEEKLFRFTERSLSFESSVVTFRFWKRFRPSNISQWFLFCILNYPPFIRRASWWREPNSKGMRLASFSLSKRFPLHFA